MEEIDDRIDNIINSRIKPLEAENEKLSNENVNLREVNQQLICKLNKLISSLAPHDVASADPSPLSSSAAEPEGVATEHHDDLELTDMKQGSKTLLLSDSIMRHVGSSCPKHPGHHGPVIDNFHLDDVMKFHEFHKVVVPGARADRLWSEAVRVSHSHPDFTNVIVCVGANYTQQFSREHAIRDIQDLLSAISQLFPNARVAWTLTLPQFTQGRPVIAGIRHVNDVIMEYCMDNDFDIIFTPEFSLFLNDYNFVRHLFAVDGIHLNRSGIEIMTSAICEYMFNHYM